MTDNGILLIDKPAGMTSFGVVARIRRVLSIEAGKRVKVGHTGTLDPFATGLMILVVGPECRNAGTYSKLDKVYEATFVLGQTSLTGDTEGELTPVSDDQPSKVAVEDVLAAFTGEIEQRPPIFSAIKIAGRRAYDLAREGKAVEMPTRRVKIHSLQLLNYTYPFVMVRAHVGSGTYIRSLAVDVGERLGIGAYCSELRRLRVGTWDVAESKTLAAFGITD